MIIFFIKDDFLKTVEAKVIIITRYVQSNETVTINKFQRLRSTFDLSAKVAHVEFPETTRPIEIKFHMKTPYNKFTKMFTNCFGRMTKMADIPIYGEKPLKIFSITRRQMTLGLGM